MASVTYDLSWSDDALTYDLAKDVRVVARAQNRFGTRLLERLEERNPAHANILCSAPSLWQALALAEAGAGGTTQAELRALLALDTEGEGDFGAANRAFVALLQEQTGAFIALANSAWFADYFRVAPAFVERARHDFDAHIATFASANPKAGAARINNWFSDQTRGEIPQVLDAADVAGAASVLANALYFRGTWAYEFNPALTRPAPFYLHDGAQIEVPMMHGRQSHALLTGRSFAGARLAYGNTSCALWVLLPHRGASPLEVLRELGEAAWQRPTSGGLVELWLPRFEMEWRANGGRFGRAGRSDALWSARRLPRDGNAFGRN